MNKLKLTPFGEFVNRHSVLTPLNFWTDLKQEVDRLADQDIDWEILIEERIAGLKEFRERYYEWSAE